MNPSFDAETYYHKTDYKEMSETELDTANDLIDIVEDSISDLSYFSVRHNDIFADQVSALEENIKRARQQL
jgi:hypothetical protein